MADVSRGFHAPAGPQRPAWWHSYRLRPSNEKVGGGRLLLYAVLGYAFAAQWEPALILANTLALLGVVMFQGALNDYWDFRLSAEPNCLGMLLQRGWLTSSQAAVVILAPLSLALPMLWWASRWEDFRLVAVLLLVGAGLSAGYAVPPLRLKSRRPWGIFVAPCLTTLMFLEAHLTLAPLTPTAIGLAVVLWQFQLYAELLHVVAMSPRSAVKYSPTAALRQLPWLAAAGVVLSLGLALAHPVFWVSVAGSTMRFRAMRTTSLRRVISQGRTHLLSRLLSLYEFAAYGGLGLVHAWRI